jgi:hypothetical protein
MFARPRPLSCHPQTKTNMLVASSKVLPDSSGGALLRRWQFKRLSTPPDMRAGWAPIDATPLAQGLLPPSGLKIVAGCNPLREPLLLAMCQFGCGSAAL